MKSLSFYATMLMIRAIGIKRIFSAKSLNYEALRARDIHVPTPQDTLGLRSSSFTVLKSKITEITPEQTQSNDVILYCPGGSFVSGPAKFNWRSVARIVKDTGLRAYMIDYPKAPECKIAELNKNIDAIYQYFMDKPGVTNVILLGGSVGGTLMALLVQRLAKQGRTLPKKLILITPMMDASMSNSLIAGIERKDVMYTRSGVLSANVMCAGKDLSSEAISPLSGSSKGFPPTLVFIAENDIQSPDAELFCAKLRRETSVKLEYGKGLPHIWPLLPMREGKQALRVIADFIRE